MRFGRMASHTHRERRDRSTRGKCITRGDTRSTHNKQRRLNSAIAHEAPPGFAPLAWSPSPPRSRRSRGGRRRSRAALGAPQSCRGGRSGRPCPAARRGSWHFGARSARRVGARRCHWRGHGGRNSRFRGAEGTAVWPGRRKIPESNPVVFTSPYSIIKIAYRFIVSP